MGTLSLTMASVTSDDIFRFKSKLFTIVLTGPTWATLCILLKAYILILLTPPPSLSSCQSSFLFVPQMCYAHFCLWTFRIANASAWVFFSATPSPLYPMYGFVPHFVQISPTVLPPLSTFSGHFVLPLQLLFCTLLYFYQHIYHCLQLYIYLITCFTIFPPGTKGS